MSDYKMDPDDLSELQMEFHKINAIGQFLLNIQPEEVAEPSELLMDMGNILAQTITRCQKITDKVESDCNHSKNRGHERP